MYLDLCLFILTYLFHRNEILMCNLNCKVFNHYLDYLILVKVGYATR